MAENCIFYSFLPARFNKESSIVQFDAVSLEQFTVCSTVLVKV